MQCIGVDIIEIGRIQEAVRHWEKRFLHRIYTERELELYQDNIDSLAARFAAKEAVMKALGTGGKGMGWHDVEILSNAQGAPVVHLYGRAQNQARRMSLKGIAISLSHCREYAIASVIGEVI